MTGFTMQPEFKENTNKQPVSRYQFAKTGGTVQDELRRRAEDDTEGRPAADKVTDKFSDNAGDNALTRYEINRSLVSPEMTNEHSYEHARQEGIEQIGKQQKP